MTLCEDLEELLEKTETEAKKFILRVNARVAGKIETVTKVAGSDRGGIRATLF